MRERRLVDEEKRMDRLDSALWRISQAEDWERMARESDDTSRARTYRMRARDLRIAANDQLGLYSSVDAYGVSEERVIDAIVRTSVQQMVAHADTVTELTAYLECEPGDGIEDEPDLL